jgi:hypothetical protein
MVKLMGNPGSLMKVTNLHGQSKTRRVVNLANGMGAEIDFGVHDNCLSNVERGILERVFFRKGKAVPRPVKGVFRRVMGSSLKRLKRILRKRSPISADEFVECYKGKRHTIYSAARDKFLAVGVKRSDAYLSTFVKAEKINFTAKPDAAPRVIQPRTPVYNVAVGRYLKPLEHDLYRAIDELCGGVTVMKGRNAYDTGQAMYELWSEFDDPVGIGADASRFDQSVSPEALEWEHSLYLYLYNNNPELALLLSWQIENRGWARTPDGVVQYRVRGSRMSGDMNTGSGNVLIMCCVVWSFFQDFRVHGKRIKWRLANNGDDCVIVVENRYQTAVAEAFPPFCDALGFKMEMEEPVQVLEEVEFCQTHPVCVGGRWCMVRNLESTLAKDLVSTKPINNERSWNMFRGAIGDCGAALTSGVPIYQDFYQYLKRGTGGVRARDDGEVTGMMNLARGMRERVVPITSSTRVSFFRAFGVDPGRQRLIEEVFAATSPHYSEPKLVSKFSYHSSLVAL